MSKNSLLITTKEASPYPGYVKSKLTIGDDGYKSYVWYGYDRQGGSSKVNDIGSLEPSNGYTSLCIQYHNDSGTVTYTLSSTKPFYYKGILYSASGSSEQQKKQLYLDFESNSGQTVDVYIQGGGRKAKRIILVANPLFI